MPTQPAKGRLGVWVFGARGGLATTLILGTRGITRGLCAPDGLLTATDLFDGVSLARLDDLVFGGHEVRTGTLVEAAQEVQERTGTIPFPVLHALRRDLTRIDRDIARGTLVNAGRTIEDVVGRVPGPRHLRAEVERIEHDIASFVQRHRLRGCVCVNLTSTEPRLPASRAHRQTSTLAAAIERNDTRAVRPSTLYAYVAARLGLPFIHFTPANSALIPAVTELFAANRAPFMGMDGKTGETLVKSSLAPMFRYRNLRVLSWQGYNMLGDRDGAVLASEENRQSKVETKDALLTRILGYPLHTHVGIDYVPSLHDLKTAWDFVHFQGFLGFRMSLQFTWQGCDAILAAPIVLDMVRLADLAHRRGEFGPMPHLACFFKKPYGVDEHDLHEQWHALVDYVRALRGGDRAI
ncbi:MAG: inositol-3-phosphate synthase [Planctomycetota bacterium]